MVEVPRVAKYRRGVGEAAFILLADCPQSISMVTWDIKGDDALLSSTRYFSPLSIADRIGPYTLPLDLKK